MKKVWASLKQLIVILLVYSFFTSCNTEQNHPHATNVSKADKTKIEMELRAANDELYAGLNEMFKGNLEPLNNLWSHSENITYMGPFGGCLTGWEKVHEDFAKVTAMKLGGKISCKDLKVYAGTDMGYTVCTEVGENMSADSTPVSVSHRATNIFHLEDGKWRLVHHHTDISPQLEKAFDKED